MGRRGPPKKPTHLKLLEGTYRKDKANHAEPKPPKGMPSCPAGLGREGKAEWRRIIPILAEMGILSTADRSTIYGYCQAWQRSKEFQRAIDDYGATFVTAQGYVCPRPEVNMAAKEARLLLNYIQQLGLSPAARSSIKVPDKKPAKADSTEEKLFGDRRTG